MSLGTTHRLDSLVRSKLVGTGSEGMVHTYGEHRGGNGLDCVGAKQGKELFDTREVERSASGDLFDTLL